jgi:hypothetical protein
MPRAYWLDTKPTKLSSALVVVEQSEERWNRIQTYIKGEADPGFDMEILDVLYNATCMVLPHRQYLLLSREFKLWDHTRYLGAVDSWDPRHALKEAKYVHFSYWPLTKPWLEPNKTILEEVQPRCRFAMDGRDEGCLERDI